MNIARVVEGGSGLGHLLPEGQAIVEIPAVSKPQRLKAGTKPFTFQDESLASEVGRWTFDELAARSPSMTVRVAFGPRLRSEVRAMRLGDALELFSRMNDGEAYARQIPVPNDLVEQGSKIIRGEMLPCDRAHIVNLWIGPKGTVQPFHKDNQNPLAHLEGMLLQLFGEKEVYLVDKRHDSAMFRRGGRIDAHHSDIDLLRFDQARHSTFLSVPVEACRIEPARTVYIPGDTWHHVKALSASVSLSVWWHCSFVADFIYRLARLERAMPCDLPDRAVTLEDVREFGGAENVLMALQTLGADSISTFLHRCVSEVRRVFVGCPSA